jgi:hypothetical protein
VCSAVCVVLSRRPAAPCDVRTQPSPGVQLAKAFGKDLSIDSTHGLASGKEQLYNLLAIDNAGHGAIIASFFCGNNDTLTVVAGLRWICHELRKRGIDLRPDSILVDDAAGLQAALEQVFPGEPLYRWLVLCCTAPRSHYGFNVWCAESQQIVCAWHIIHRNLHAKMVKRLGTTGKALEVVKHIWVVVRNGRDDEVVEKVDELIDWMYESGCDSPRLSDANASFHPDAVKRRLRTGTRALSMMHVDPCVLVRAALTQCAWVLSCLQVMCSASRESGGEQIATTTATTATTTLRAASGCPHGSTSFTRL